MKETQSTQQFVDIQEIRKGAVILKNGGLRKVLMVGGINFALKSEEEQNIIAFAYQGFLNALDFSVQFVIHSRKMNIADYLAKLAEYQTQETNELLKNQIAEYIEFIRSFVEMNEVMAKNFFAVVPYDSVQLSKKGRGLLDTAKNLIGSLGILKKPAAPQGETQNIEEQIQQLERRTEIVINGLSQIGLRVVPLNDEELIELFYNLYNPREIEKKELKIARE